MAPNQRLSITIMGSLLLLGVGRLWLFTTLTSKPEEIATNIQGELEDTLNDEQENTMKTTTPKNGNTLSNPDAFSEGSITVPSPFPLTILLPPRVQQDKITELLNRIDPEKYFQPTIIQPSTLAAFLRAIDVMSTGNRQVDIILLPRQERTRIHKRSAQIDRSDTNAPTGQFHPQIGKLLTASESMFVPHAIDPRVTVTKTSTKKLSLGTFLQNHRSPLQYTPDQILTDPLLLQITTLWLEQLYSSANLTLLPKIFLTTATTPCMMRSHCLTTDSETSALRLPLSELTDQDIEQFSVNLFPSLDETVPTTVRGRVVRGNDPSLYVQQRLLWIQKYLTVMSNDQLPYESFVLPAYFPRLKRLILQDERARIHPSLYKLDLIEHSTKELDERFTTIPFTMLLDGSYRPELYLEKRREIRTQQ